jgi:hypothetical protein
MANMNLKKKELKVFIQSTALFLVLPTLSLAIGLASYRTIVHMGWWARSLVVAAALTTLGWSFKIIFAYNRCERERWLNSLLRGRSAYPHWKLLNLIADVLDTAACFAFCLIVVGHELRTPVLRSVYWGVPIEVICVTAWASCLSWGHVIVSVIALLKYPHPLLKQRVWWMFATGVVLSIAFPLMHMVFSSKYPAWMQYATGTLVLLLGFMSYARVDFVTRWFLSFVRTG